MDFLSYFPVSIPLFPYYTTLVCFILYLIISRLLPLIPFLFDFKSSVFNLIFCLLKIDLKYTLISLLVYAIFLSLRSVIVFFFCFIIFFFEIFTSYNFVHQVWDFFSGPFLLTFLSSFPAISISLFDGWNLNKILPYNKNVFTLISNVIVLLDSNLQAFDVKQREAAIFLTLWHE